jgi:hypothetical protein
MYQPPALCRSPSTNKQLICVLIEMNEPGSMNIIRPHDGVSQQNNMQVITKFINCPEVQSAYESQKWTLGDIVKQHE